MLSKYHCGTWHKVFLFIYYLFGCDNTTMMNRYRRAKKTPAVSNLHEETVLLYCILMVNNVTVDRRVDNGI